MTGPLAAVREWKRCSRAAESGRSPGAFSRQSEIISRSVLDELVPEYERASSARDEIRNSVRNELKPRNSRPAYKWRDLAAFLGSRGIMGRDEPV
jgi:hypothetical protein